MNGSKNPVTIRSLHYVNVPACMHYEGARTYLPNASGELAAWGPNSEPRCDPDRHYHPAPLEGATLPPGQGLPHDRFVMSRFKVIAAGPCDFHGPAVVRYETGGNTYEQKLQVVMGVKDAVRH